VEPRRRDDAASSDSAAAGDERTMAGYTADTYGRAFADVYDDWYHDLSDVDALAAVVDEHAPAGAVCELGVGTGRVALAIAARGRRVIGIDVSSEMLEQLAVNDTERTIVAVRGDMVDDLVTATHDEHIAAVVAAYNTVFNLHTEDRQRALFASVATVLAPGGIFVIEAAVPPSDDDSSTTVGVRSMTTERVVLSVARHHGDDHIAEGHFIEFTDGDRVRLRPWSIRYLSITEVDQMATDAGLVLDNRFADWDGSAFTSGDDNHISIYRRLS
jgi:SAM-dependent methyltransferase